MANRLGKTLVMNITNRNRTIIERIVIVLITIAVCVFLLEIGLRLVGPNQYREGIFEQYKDFYRLKKNLTISKKIRMTGGTTVYTNYLGYRDFDGGERDFSNKRCYAFLGASDVFGNALEYQDTFVGLFSRYASTEDIGILNLGIGGHRLDYQVELFKQLIENNNIDVRKVFFCVNPVSLAEFVDKRDYLLVIKGNPFHIPHMRNPLVGLMIKVFPSTLIFVGEHWRKLKEVYWTTTLPPSLAAFSKTHAIRETTILTALEAFLDGFKHYCKSKEIDLAYVYLPIIQAFEMDTILRKFNLDPKEFEAEFYEKLMGNYCDRRALSFINLGPILKEHFEKGEKLTSDVDPHYNEFASRLVAEYLIDKTFPLRKSDPR